MNDAALEALREALKLSPDNVPLRQHLAELLMGLARYSEAAQEYRQALALSPDHGGLKLGLAKAFLQDGKNSQALVVVEDLLKRPDAPAAAHVLHAKLLVRAGEIERAVREYKEALKLDPESADPELAAQLGVGPNDDDSELFEGKLRGAWDAPGEGADVNVERPKIAFQDVGGMDAVKDEVRMKIIHPLTHAEMFKAYGKAIGGGILMFGPPGCGKTHLARATAGEISARFLAVGINDILDMWIGNSEKNLHELFEQARRSKPCVLFFDEVDALAASRSDMLKSGGRQLINQFLSELDGIGASNDGLLILAATNAPWHLDAAFRRPGRFDRILFVPPPDQSARAAILRILLEGKPVDRIDYDQVAKKTPDCSGADLKALVDVAVEAKLREALKTGVPAPLTTKDLVGAAKEIRQTSKEWFATARNYALYANQSGTYDDILKYLKT